METLTTASEIKDGQLFKSPGQRKWRQAGKVLWFTPDERKKFGTDILVCQPDCSQIEFKEDDPVLFPEFSFDRRHYSEKVCKEAEASRMKELEMTVMHPQYGQEKKLKKRTKQQIARREHVDEKFSQFISAIHVLRCNVKSLAAEARFIRHEERRAGLCYVDSLRDHRIRVLREESRYAGLALAFIRGKSKFATEGNSKAIDLTRLTKKIRRFLPTVGDKDVFSWLTKDKQ